GAEDAGEDVAGFDGGELVRVADEDEAGVVGDGVDELGHQGQVDHRGFVDDDHVERQRVVGVVAEAGAVGDGAEQAVQGGAAGGQGFDDVGVGACGGQRLQGVADAFGHAFRGAAGGRGQGDARVGAAFGARLFDQLHQELCDGRGLAGAGAAGDEVDAASTAALGGEALQAGGDVAFVLAVAAQVEQAGRAGGAFEDQRAGGVGGFGGGGGVRRGDPARGGQFAVPGVGVGPRDVVGAVVAQQQLRRRRIEAGVSAGDGE